MSLPHRPPPTSVARGLVGLTVVAGLVCAMTTGAARASTGGANGASRAPSAAHPVTPGSFTGFGFDQCHTPSQKKMDVWLQTSPFWAVGVYLSGSSRFCRAQPHLTSSWIATQQAAGWRILPITLGPQAFCNPRFPRYDDDPVISRVKADHYSAARIQGRAEARSAVAAATDVGLLAPSTLWYDIEAFDIGNKTCRASTLQFLTGWTNGLHVLGYVSGIYSSGASGIRAIDRARIHDTTFTAPDMLWIADWNGRATTQTKWVRDDGWADGARMHQYRGGHDETHGGVTINIDSSFLQVGRGSVARKAPVHCDGVTVDFATYPSLTSAGTRPAHLQAAQCLLSELDLYRGRITGVFNQRTAAAVSAYRSTLDLAARPALTRRVWTALLSSGRTSLQKYGAAGDQVRRLQRALNAAGDPRLEITGVFDSPTALAVKLYQKALGLPMTGVVTDDLWADLQVGAR